MPNRIREDAPAQSGAGFLRGRVEHLFEHARHAEQIGGFEPAQIGEQVLGAGHIAHDAVTADGRVLDVAREAMREGQE